jgi:regulatory protein
MNLKEALNYSMALCSSRERCRSEIAGKLRERKIPESDIEEILASLEQQNFINEERYATSFVQDKLKINKWGKLKIRYALGGKEIAAATIENALEQIDEEEYTRILREELGKKRKSIKGSNAFDLRGKLYRFAQQRGFEGGIIHRLIDEIV